MRAIMTVLDCFQTSNDGVIISGSNPLFNKISDEEIKMYIGDAILIRYPDQSELVIQGIVIDIATSLLGQKNIHIRLPKTIQLAEIKAGATVYSIIE